ncbi:MAG: aquaporin family protein [Bacteroidales bacterium]|nr:MAG: aquaporin family protein [Bacteroidales bacterium]
MDEYFAEFLGTSILILLGNGAVANVCLRKTKGENSGWIVITAGWGMAVFIAVFTVGPISGAHINPAVTLGLAVSGLFGWDKVIPFLIAQVLGGMTGGFLVYSFYKDHFNTTDNPDAKLACFCTIPNIRNLKVNFLSEVIGTFILVFAVLFVNLPHIEIEGLGNAKVGLGSLEALPVGLVVFAIGLSLGGTTGYAINPARDFGPRLIHYLLPIKGKRDSDWHYSWIPIAGPVCGAFISTLFYFFINWISA